MVAFNSFFFLNFFCQEVLDEVKGVLKSGQIIHHKGLKEDREIYFDKNFLKIILFNLITNAAKYSIDNQMIQLNMTIISLAIRYQTLTPHY